MNAGMALVTRVACKVIRFLCCHRIFDVVEIYNALLSVQLYREAWSEKDTIEDIKEQSGKAFDG